MKESKKLKKLMAVILAVCMMFSSFTITSFAATEDEANIEVAGETYTNGEFEYCLLDDGTAEITEYSGTETELTIPSEIDGYTVTSIGCCAFEDCTSLVSVTIPDSVISIDIYAFSYCTSLTNVTIPNSVTSIEGIAFLGCTSLENIKVDNKNQNYCSVDGVLFNKDKTDLIKYPAGSTLKTYSIPDGVTIIGDSAFDNCTSLASVTIPDSVTSIGYDAFRGCKSIASVTIPDSITEISGGAFRGCTSLANVTIGNSVTSIGGNAFGDCTSLVSVTIPDSVTSIGYAFYNCTSLTNVTIGNSVTSINSYAFYNCTSLENIKVDNKNQNYCSVDGVLFNKDKTDLIQYPAGSTLKTYSIPDGVTEISYVAFSGCISLANVTIPDSVTSIGWYAFEDCTSLTNVTIPDSVSNIGGYAFSGCTSLESIKVDNKNQNYCSVDGVLFNKDKTDLIKYPAGSTLKTYSIPDGVTSIDSSAFSDCTSLKNVTIPDSVSNIGGYAFSGCTSLESIVIPKHVTSISNGNDVFYGCTSLKSLSVDSDNKDYYSIDNALYRKIDNSLIYYPEALDIENVELPSGVEKITPLSFANRNVKSVNLPDTVTEIMYLAFSNCTSLAYVNIPESVKSIGYGDYSPGNTFFNCESLKAITIPSSVEEIGYHSFGYGYYFDEENEYQEKPYNDFTIYGKSGSAAETYANENNFTFVDLDNKNYSHADKTSGINVVAKADAELSVTKISDKQSIDDVKVLIENNESILGMYDISLMKDGNKVQHEGMAEVQIPCSDENAKVYRLESDNTLTDMNAVYKDGKLLFYTEHFSKYVVTGESNCVCGDVNGDGEINAKDRMMLTRYLAKWSGYENIDMTAADVNSDNEVNAKDRMILTRHLAKWSGYETLPLNK